jgi:peptidoglycan hydrolase-like protein with peptidoglycan-binding domain
LSFQSQHIGDKFMTSTPTVADPMLRQGDSGAAVSELQQLLKAKGINIAVDGVFGSATRAAVVQFQQQNGLAVDGIVGPKTWQALRQDDNAPIQLTNAASYYEPSNYPHQKEAFEWLQSQISRSALEEFARRWRNLR